MYTSDYDEHMFVYADTNAADSRSNVSITTTTKNMERWYNVLMPYIKNNNVFSCPSDPAPTPSNNAGGNPGIPRSYIACRSAESLALAQIDDPVETLVIVDKWDKNSGGAVGDNWIESFNGDFDPDNGAGYDHAKMYKAGNRHQGFVNCVFFDGHAKALTASAIQGSKDLTGCNLINRYPVANVMTTSVTSSAPNEPNICSGFTYPAN